MEAQPNSTVGRLVRFAKERYDKRGSEYGKVLIHANQRICIHFHFSYGEKFILGDPQIVLIKETCHFSGLQPRKNGEATAGTRRTSRRVSAAVDQRRIILYGAFAGFC